MDRASLSGFPAAPLKPRARLPRPQADTTSLYEALGLEKGASSSEIRRAYMKLARTVRNCHRAPASAVWPGGGTPFSAGGRAPFGQEGWYHPAQ